MFGFISSDFLISKLEKYKGFPPLANVNELRPVLLLKIFGSIPPLIWESPKKPTLILFIKTNFLILLSITTGFIFFR